MNRTGLVLMCLGLVSCGCEGGLRGMKPLSESDFRQLKTALEDGQIEVNSAKQGNSGSVGYLYLEVTLNLLDMKSGNSSVSEIFTNIRRLRDHGELSFPVDYVSLQCWAPTFFIADFKLPPPTDGQNKGGQQKGTRFSKASLSFDYPRGWKEHPDNRVTMMKEHIGRELHSHGISLRELAMIVGPNDEAMLLVSKYTISKVMTHSEFLKERNHAYDDALQSGNVTNANIVQETMIATLPAVVEDVERSNGERARTCKILDGKTIFEISLVVMKARQFSEYSMVFDRLLASVKIAGKPDTNKGMLSTNAL